jgi:hypothetical protein
MGERRIAWYADISVGRELGMGQDRIAMTGISLEWRGYGLI